MVTVEQMSSDFARIFGDEPKLEHLATGFGFTEGPVWRGDHLLFSDIPRSRIVRYQDQDDGRRWKEKIGACDGLTRPSGQLHWN